VVRWLRLSGASPEALRSDAEGGGPTGGPSALHPPSDPADASPRRDQPWPAAAAAHVEAAAGNWNPRLWDWDSRALTARPSADALRLAGGQPQPQHVAEEHRQGAGESVALKLQLGPRPRRTPARHLPWRRCRRPRLLRGRTQWSGRASGGGNCCCGGGGNGHEGASGCKIAEEEAGSQRE
jgi:hypothetical protein